MIRITENSTSSFSTHARSGILSDNFLFSHVLGSLGTQSNASHHELGSVGCHAGILTPSSSPHTNSSSSSIHGGHSFGAMCVRCDTNASNRCLDCNDPLCRDCIIEHQNHPHCQDHCVVPISNLSPIGSSASFSNGSPQQGDAQCDIHGEILR